MFKKKALKLYRKVSDFEQVYGSKMADTIVYGRVWYKLTTYPASKVLQKLIKKPKLNRIVFDCKEDYSKDAKALCDYLVDNGYLRQYKVTWIVNEPKEYSSYKRRHLTFVKRKNPRHGFATIAALKAAYQGKVIFFDHSLDWLTKKTKGQLQVHLGRGGEYRRATAEETETVKFDAYLTIGELFVKELAKDYQCSPKKILPLGRPRYTKFKSDQVKALDFLCTLTINTADHWFIWMPLERPETVMAAYQGSSAPMFGLPLIHCLGDMLKLDALCKEAQVHLLIPVNEQMRTLYKEVTDLTYIHLITEEELQKNQLDLYELLPLTKGLITDFAPVGFDYLLLDRPMGFVLEDVAEYEQAGGFVFEQVRDYMPGQKIETLEDFALFFTETIEGKDENKEKRRELRALAHHETTDYCKAILAQFNIRTERL